MYIRGYLVNKLEDINPIISKYMDKGFTNVTYKVLRSNDKFRVKLYADRKKMPLSPFAKLIKKTRLNKGLTQEDLCTKLGIGLTAYNTYETGKRAPSGGILLNLIDTLDLEIRPKDGVVKAILEPTLQDKINLIKGRNK